jgi:inner membrane protein
MAFSGACYLLPRLLHVPVTLDLAFYAVLLGSLFPDIDHPRALLPRHFTPFLLVSKLTVHRGIVHSLIASIAFALTGLGISLWLSFSSWVAFGFWFGYATHLIADSITKSGIKWLQPLSERGYLTGPFRTGGFFEQVLFVSFTAGALYLLLFATA